MSVIWVVLCLAGILWGLCSPQPSTLLTAVLSSGADALRLGLTLGGAMMLWSGLLGVLEQTGDADRLARMLRLLLRPLFPGVTDESCWRWIGLNLSANILGLGNAATPAGLQAASQLAAQGASGRRGLAMLLTLDLSCLQLLPASVISLRAVSGCADPSGVWLPTLAASAASTLTAVLLMVLLPAPKGGW